MATAAMSEQRRGELERLDLGARDGSPCHVKKGRVSTNAP